MCPKHANATKMRLPLLCPTFTVHVVHVFNGDAFASTSPLILNERIDDGIRWPMCVWKIGVATPHGDAGTDVDASLFRAPKNR